MFFRVAPHFHWSKFVEHSANVLLGLCFRTHILKFMTNGCSRKRRVVIDDSDTESVGAESVEVECNVAPTSVAPVTASTAARVQPGVSTRPVARQIRRWMLITFSHTEGKEITLEEACDKVAGLFDTVRLVGVAEDHHETLGEHFHIAYESRDASYKTCTRRVREAFSPLFEGRGINVSFHRAWSTMLVYVAKDQPDLDKAVVRGDYSLENAVADLRAKKCKKALCVSAIQQHVEANGSVAALAYNDSVAPFMLTNCNSVLRYAELVQNANVLPETKETIRTLGAQGSVDGATGKLNRDQLAALDAFVDQLKGRKHRQPHVYCVGPTQTGKTYPFYLLSTETRCFTPCMENNDRAFAGYSDELHDWILINDFHDNVKFQLLSNLCEGMPMKLNGYGVQHQKKRNIPIVFTANALLQYRNVDQARVDALNTRMKTFTFTEKVPEDSEELCVKDLCAYLMTKL